MIQRNLKGYMAENTQRNHQELCLLYENAAANLETLKKRQWQVYVFYSTIVAFLTLKDKRIINELYIKILISLLLLIGLIVVEFAQAYFRSDMLKFRDILRNIYERFGYLFREIRGKAKGEKKAELNPFERIFRHGGCAYIFVVFAYAMVVFWIEELKQIGCLVYILILILIVLVIFIPLVMDKCVNYINKKNKVEELNGQ
ncbi:MAG: hypothetical protein AB1390_10285 [Nitrospirota bacterium]